jgi:outer membrane receptor protein involved in Fe transport
MALAAASVPVASLAAQVGASASYDLPEQELGDQLRAIARASGREILFAPETVRGLTAPALKGAFTIDEAIRAVLAGTTLVVEYRSGAILVRSQTDEDIEHSGSPTEGGLVTVTGTRIRGGGSASPVIVTSREALEKSGVTDLAGFTRVLPQNFTGGQNPGVAGGGQQGGQVNINNSATLNLRGLGPDATLTLIDGHRIAYDALSQGVDIAAIPLNAIERIEVIADGSSALYGSDAVGGVANILLRRDYDGLEVSARAGASTDGGNVQQQYGAMAGRRWRDGGFMFALDHSRATPIYADQRDYTESVDPSLTLTLRNRQTSGIVSAHQQITGGLAFEIDAIAMQRRSRKQSPFLPNADVSANGLVTEPGVRTYSATPTLRIDLPASWQASLSATHAVSRTTLDTSRYFNGSAMSSRLIYENRLNDVEATSEGPLVTLPAGDVRLAVGGGVRRLALGVNITDFLASGPVTARDFTESRRVQFAYGELSIPLVAPRQRVPLVERLTLSGALRYERWKGIDTVATPKIGLVYQPHPDVTLRATWGRSFKAPTLNQVNQPLQGVLLPGFLFSPPPQPPLPAGDTVLLLGGGNPGLRSERATNWSTSLEVRPRQIEGLRLEASYFDIDYQDRIGSPLSGTLSALANPIFRDLIVFDPSVDQVNALIAAFPQGLSNQTGQAFDPGRVGAIIDGALRNTARERIRGFDLLADYEVKLGGSGQLVLTGAASYLESTQQLASNQPVFEKAGIIFNPPHWRARLGTSWKGPTAGVSAFLNYVGSTRDNRFPLVEMIGPFVTLDLSASVRLGGGPLHGLELRASALNLLNEEPDVIRNSQPEAPPYDSTNQSPVGRFLGLSLRKAW